MNSNPTITQLGLKLPPLQVTKEVSGGFAVYDLTGTLSIQGKCPKEVNRIEVKNIFNEWTDILFLGGQLNCSTTGTFSFETGTLSDYVAKSEDTIEVRGTSGTYYTTEESFKINIKSAKINSAMTDVTLANVASYTISGECKFMDSVKVTVGSEAPVVATCSNGTFSKDFDLTGVTESGSPTVVPVKLSSATTTNEFFTTSFQKDATAPSEPTSIVLKTPATTPANAKTPTFTLGGLEVGNSVNFYSTADCSGTALKTVTATATSMDIVSTSLADGQYFFHAKTIDAFGNPSTCSAASGYYDLETIKEVAQIDNPLSGESHDVLLNFTISAISQGVNDRYPMTRFKYKIAVGGINHGGTYAGETLLNVDGGGNPTTGNITNYDISGLADGLVHVCVIGGDALGNWQDESSSTCYEWTKDTSLPSASLLAKNSVTGLYTDIPWSSGFSNQVLFDLRMSSSLILEYRYKTGTGAPDCSGAWASAAWTPIATRSPDLGAPDIALDISVAPEGGIYICLLGKDSAGLEQVVPTIISWTKDTVKPTLINFKNKPLTPAATLGDYRNKYKTISGIANDTTGSEIAEYKYKRANAFNVASPATRASNSTEAQAWADQQCQSATGYSSYIPYYNAMVPPVPGDDMVMNAPAMSDGWVYICFTGRDYAANDMDLSAGGYHGYVWYMDTTAPTAAITNPPTSGLPNNRNNKISIDFGADGGDVHIGGTDVNEDPQFLPYKPGIINYKFKFFATGAYTVPGSLDCSGTNNLGYEHALADEFSFDISGLSDGLVYLCVIGQDYAGNYQTDANATKVWWWKDTTAPLPVITNAPENPFTNPNHESRVVDFSPVSKKILISDSIADTNALSPIVKYRYKFGSGAVNCNDGAGAGDDYIDGGSGGIDISNPEITDVISGLPEGPVYLCVQAVDAVGNWRTNSTVPVASSVNWVKDTTPPVARVSGGPAAVPADGRIAAVHKTDGLTPNITNSDSNMVALNLTVDSVAGDVVGYKYKIVDTGSKVASNPNCASASGNSEISLVDVNLTDDPIDDNISALNEGQISICVYGRDYAGNWQYEGTALPTTYSWIKDTIAPIVTFSGTPTIQDMPNNKSMDQILNINVGSSASPNDGVMYYNYNLGTGAKDCTGIGSAIGNQIVEATNITNNITVSPNLANGPVYVCAIGRDLAGNWQISSNAQATAFEWVKDTEAPTAVVNNDPLEYLNGNITSNPQNRNRQIDFSEIGKEISVAGVDDGNIDKVLTHYKYKFLSGSTCTVGGFSAQKTAVTKITDNIGPSGLNLADGFVSLCVIGRDASGNWQDEAAATKVTWYKDTTPPIASASGGPSGAVTNTLGTAPDITNIDSNLKAAQNITIAGTDVVSYKYVIVDKNTISAGVPDCSAAAIATEKVIATHITDSLQTLAMDEGQISVCIYGKDIAGNWQYEGVSAHPTTYSWRYDITPPEVTLSGTPVLNGSNETNVSAIDIAVNSSVAPYDGYVYYSYLIGTGSPTDCSAVDLSVGAQKPSANHIADSLLGYDSSIDMWICVVGKDRAGNWQDVANATWFTWKNDRVAPIVTADDCPSNSTCLTGTSSAKSKDTALNVTLTKGAQEVTHYKYKLGAGHGDCSFGMSSALSIGAGSVNLTDAISGAEGEWHLCISGGDDLGNFESPARLINWTKDTTAPANITLGGSLPDSGARSNLTSGIISIAGFDTDAYSYALSVDAGDSVYHSDFCTNNSYTKSWGGSGVRSGASFPSYNYSVATADENYIYVCLIGTDDTPGGNSSAPLLKSYWVLDTTPPIATMTGQPTGTSNSTAITVDVAGTQVAHYKYKFGAGTADCTIGTWIDGGDAVNGIAEATNITSYNISGLADGNVYLCVKGKDAAGNWQSDASATTNAVNWTKDTTAPGVISITGYPSDPSKDLTLAVDIADGGDWAYYKYKIGNSGSVSCTDNTTGGAYSAATAVTSSIEITSTTPAITSLTEGGVIKLCIIGGDSLQNFQAYGSATSHTWTKDTTAPTATIAGVPTGRSLLTSISATISGTGVTGFKYKLAAGALDCATGSYDDGGDATNGILPATGISNVDISGFAEGNVYLCVIGRDLAGNWKSQATATSASWTKDTTKPIAAEVTISGTPAGFKNMTGAGDLTGIENNSTVLNLTIGGTDLTHYAYKAFRVGDVGSISVPDCGTDGSGYSSSRTVGTLITDTIHLAGLNFADGQIAICIVSKDTAGNWQDYTNATTYSWIKDTSAPSSITLSGVPTLMNNSTLSIDITGASDVAQFKYKIENTPGSGCNVSAALYTGPFSVDPATGATHFEFTTDGGLSDGGVRLCIIGIDTAGNTMATSAANESSWTKDTTPPVPTISGAPTGSSNVVILNVDIGVADEYKYRFISSASCGTSGYSGWISASTNITDDISAEAEGSLYLCVIGRDTALNESTPVSVNWTKDTLAPTSAITTISGQPTDPSNSIVMNIDVGGTGIINYQYKFGSGATTCTGGGYSGSISASTNITNDISSSPNLADGIVYLCVLGVDAAGNLQDEADATSFSWTKDTEAPTSAVTTISGEPTGTNNFVVMNIDVAGTGIVNYQYKFGSGATTCTGGGYSGNVSASTNITNDISSSPNLADGTVYLCVLGVDAAGNVQAQADATTASWTKDTQAPTATITGAPTGVSNSYWVNIAVSGTGVTHYKYKIIDGSDFSGATPNCTGLTGESEIAVATPISEDISSKADGYMFVCVIARDASGNWQASHSTTVNAANWTKDAGSNHMCALSGTSLSCWGLNNHGQVGDNSTTNRNSLATVNTTNHSNAYLKVSVGTHHTCAIGSDDSLLYCWGADESGQLGNGAGTSNVLKPTVIDSPNTYTEVSAGSHHTCAIRTGGDLYCWGNNGSGQLGDSSTTVRSAPTFVDSGYSLIAAGGNHTCGIKSDNSLYCWGDNSHGQIENSGNSSVPVQVGTGSYIAISVGAYHSCAIQDTTNDLYCWGADNHGQLGNGSGSSADVSAPVKIGSNTYSKLALGLNHSCAIATDNSLYCWGLNTNGQVGDSTTAIKHAPTAVSDSPNAYLSVSSGGTFTCGDQDDTTDSLRCWGTNYFGITGSSGDTNQTTPTEVSSGTFDLAN